MAAKTGFEKTQVVVLSSIDWDSAWQRHQVFAAQFAAAGHDVFFVENSGFRNPGPADASRVLKKLGGFLKPSESADSNLPERLQLIRPRLLPPTFGGFRRLNAAALIPRLAAKLRRLGLRPGAVVIVYSPTASHLELLSALKPSAVVYDCASNFRAHPQAPKDLAQQEGELLRRSSLVVCDSDFLYRQKKAEHANVLQLHHGVSQEFFNTNPPSGNYRRFCYFGTWSRDLDSSPLVSLSEAGFEVAVLGPSKGAAPALPDTVHRLPPVRPQELARKLETFDAFLWPYRRNSFLDAVVPAKLYECLAMGRPILASPLRSLAPFEGLMYFAEAPADWARIARSLPDAETPAKREARVALAREHTNEKEFARLCEAVRAAWERRS